tara:strand:- start:1076 stop:2917 length:1842 start_codon:yes stop_codon:yes gene_type:complete
MKLVFDIETNGLDPDIIWMIAAEDLEGNKHFFTDHEAEYPSIAEGVEFLSKASTLIGHNIVSYDFPVLEKLTSFKLGEDQKIIDTMLLSQLNDFTRPAFEPFMKNKFGGKHNMKIWSQFLGGEVKHDDPSWLEYSVEMKERCISDVSINVLMYRYMAAEARDIIKMQSGYPGAIKLEHDIARVMAEQEQTGWYIDKDAANALYKDITRMMDQIEEEVVPQLKPRIVMIDKEPREAKRLKNGEWDRVTREWFGDDEVTSPYQRTKTVPTDLGNNDAVINLLLEQGWKPTEYNFKKDVDGNWEKRGPKLTEDSFESITGSLGIMVSNWRTYRSRAGLIKGLAKNIRPDGRVGCRAFVVGTNTFRMRQAGIVNIPGGRALLGKEVRKLFSSEAGRQVVACDSDSNQLRAFAHYLNNKEVSDAIASGTEELGTDIHTRNANAIGVDRPTAKTVIYALLFGAGDAKIAESAGKKGQGKQVRAALEEAMPGFKNLTKQIGYEHEVNKHTYGRGFVTGLDGRRIYCDAYKALNGLLQTFEAITCKSAVAEAFRVIKLEGLDAKPMAMIHDEMNLDVADKDIERVRGILEHSFGPYITDKYSLNIPMGGSAAAGANWSEVH